MQQIISAYQKHLEKMREHSRNKQPPKNGTRTVDKIPQLRELGFVASNENVKIKGCITASQMGVEKTLDDLVIRPKVHLLDNQVSKSKTHYDNNECIIDNDYDKAMKEYLELGHWDEEEWQSVDLRDIYIDNSNSRDLSEFKVKISKYDPLRIRLQDSSVTINNLEPYLYSIEKGIDEIDALKSLGYRTVKAVIIRSRSINPYRIDISKWTTDRKVNLKDKYWKGEKLNLFHLIWDDIQDFLQSINGSRVTKIARYEDQEKTYTFKVGHRYPIDGQLFIQENHIYFLSEEYGVDKFCKWICDKWNDSYISDKNKVTLSRYLKMLHEICISK